jgi:hypothetical protein
MIGFGWRRWASQFHAAEEFEDLGPEGQNHDIHCSGQDEAQGVKVL